MKLNIFLMIGLFLFAISCGNDSITSQNGADEGITVMAETGSNPLNISNGKEVTKPLAFKKVTGTLEFVPNPIVCGPFDGFMQIVAPGSGVGTHVGRFDVTNRWCINESGDPISPVLAVVIAANGDELYAEMIGMEPDLENPPYEFLYYEITGGTGRFDGASGSYTMYGITDFVALTWSHSGEGEITY